MSETKPLILYSRSAVAADWTCQRKRYYNYEYSGRGIAPETTALPLYFGTLIHDGVAAIVAGIDIEEIIRAAVGQFRVHLLVGQEDDRDASEFADEQCALGEGLLRGFHRLVWPIYKEEYDVVSVEQELFYEHDGLTFMSKPDLVLRHKETGELVYLELKTTSSTKDQWMTSWTYAVQLHSTVRAIENTLGEKVERVIVQGLNKSYVSQYDRQESIFCYAYHKEGNPPFTQSQVAYTYRAGLKKYPTWKLPGGVKKWVEEMPEAILSQQFPQTMPIFVNNDLVDAFFRQRAVREKQIRASRETIARNQDNPQLIQEVLDMTFPQTFEACSPGWGTGCQYRKLCFGNYDDPTQAGFKPRISHHAAEAALHEGNDSL